MNRKICYAPHRARQKFEKLLERGLFPCCRRQRHMLLIQPNKSAFPLPDKKEETRGRSLVSTVGLLLVLLSSSKNAVTASVFTLSQFLKICQVPLKVILLLWHFCTVDKLYRRVMAHFLDHHWSNPAVVFRCKYIRKEMGNGKWRKPFHA